MWVTGYKSSAPSSKSPLGSIYNFITRFSKSCIQERGIIAPRRPFSAQDRYRGVYLLTISRDSFSEYFLTFRHAPPRYVSGGF